MWATRLLTVLFLLLSFGTAHGAAYTVGPSGKDYTAIQACLNAATTAGDSCTVFAGDYSGEGVLASAASGSNATTGLITLQINGTDTVTIARIRITHNYFKLNGFRINAPLNGTSAGVYITGNYNQITNNYLYNGIMGNPGSYAMYITGTNNTISGNTLDGPTRAVGSHTGANGAATLTDSTKSWTTDEHIGYRIYKYNESTGNGNFGTVTANTSNNVTAPLSAGETWDTGEFYILGPTFYIGFSDTGSHNTYSGNTIHNLGDVERIWDLFGHEHIIDGNNAHDISASGTNLTHIDILQSFGLAGAGTSYGHIIRNNFFHNINGQILMCEQDATAATNYATDVRDWSIYNNIFSEVKNAANPGCTGFLWYNNTFYHSGYNAAGGAHPIAFFKGATGNGDGGIVKNNIFIGCGNYPDGEDSGWYAAGGSSITADYNYVTKLTGYGARTGFNAVEAHGVNGGDPKFVSAGGSTAASYALTADAPTNVGVDLSGTFTVDYAGTTRMAPWNIGAHEYIQLGNISGSVLSGAVVK